MKWKSPALVQVLICAAVAGTSIALLWLTETRSRFTAVQRLEWMTYDARVRLAARSSPPVATNLGFVAITDDSIRALLNGALPYRFGLHWPRQVHGRLVDELRQQGAKAIGFDIVFAELRPDPPMRISNAVIASDAYFAQQLKASSNIILAAEKGLVPHALFRSNAWATADISARRDADGTLRRARVFTEAISWHPLLKEYAHLHGASLESAQIQPRELLLPDRDGKLHRVPLESSNAFDTVALSREMIREMTGNAPPSSPAVLEPAFERLRLWQMGLLLAARELGLDLARAEIDLGRGRISIPLADGTRREIPVDREGRMLIDWTVTTANRALTTETIESLLDQFEARRDGRSEDVTNRWRDKLVVVGVTATGNDLSDLGATPLEPETCLLSQHWNIANAVLTNRFIQPLTFHWSVFLILGFVGLAGTVTCKAPTIGSVAAILAMSAGYVAIACWAFVQDRVLLPIVLPVGGGLLTTHVALIAYLVRKERRERQRTRAIFGKVVSPAIVRELLGQEKLTVQGERRRLTVFFADIRGFTDMTDAAQRRAAGVIAERGLTGRAAELLFDSEAERVLNTVNAYLGVIAEIVIKHNGTLDKYIGDCVMAFWGAPNENRFHARDCIRAVIEAQRAVLALNREREAENRRRAAENEQRTARGEEPLPMLDLLSMGSGINTGFMTVGTVGSAQHIMNYTVFGREVNLASRLESASGRSRIVIGEGTYADLLRDDPALAATCRPLPLLSLKGFADAIQAYEVPWQNDAAESLQASAAAAAHDEGSSCI